MLISCTVDVNLYNTRVDKFHAELQKKGEFFFNFISFFVNIVHFLLF